MQLTRRQLAAALAIVPISGLPGRAAPQAGEDLTAARRRVQANAQALAATPIPMSLEPAFVFKA